MEKELKWKPGFILWFTRIRFQDFEAVILSRLRVDDARQ